LGLLSVVVRGQWRKGVGFCALRWNLWYLGESFLVLSVVFRCCFGRGLSFWRHVEIVERCLGIEYTE
jgi:hypothetical protein